MGFLLAAAGSAVGLGNIWKFPYIVGQHGGGAFVLVYLLCLLAVGFPALLAEFYVGQQGQAGPVDSFLKLRPTEPHWRIAGLLGLLSSVLITAFYSNVGGWILAYLAKALTAYQELSSPQELAQAHGKLMASPLTQLFWQWSFLAICLGIVSQGLQGGLERCNRWMMPLLLALLSALLLYSSQLPGFSKALHFLFDFRGQALHWRSLWEAVGHAFFTISVGVGIMTTYGSYLPKGQTLLSTALTLLLTDTLIALGAGVVVFTCTYSFGLAASSGPALLFETLPLLLIKMPGAPWLFAAFFLLVSFTAITSCISLLEVGICYLEQKGKCSRKKATALLGSLALILGSLCSLSLNILGEWRLAGRNLFQLLDSLSSRFLLPLSALLGLIFFAWKLLPNPKDYRRLHPSPLLSSCLFFLCRFLAPLAIGLILLLGSFLD